MSFALPARQITFGRTNASTQHQPYQYQQPQQQHGGLALPGGSSYIPQPSNSLALPGPSPLSNSYTPSQSQQKQAAPIAIPATPSVAAAVTANATSVAVAAGPSSPPTTQVPATPVPLTLEQQHITAVEGIVPTLQNIVATVNLDCRLDLKTIALHARNAEYNPKVGDDFINA